MSDSDEVVHTRNVIIALKALREKTEKLSVLEPNWMNFDSIDANVSDRNKEKFLVQLFSTFLIGDLTLNVPGQIPALSCAKDTEILNWYKNEFSHARKKAFSLLLKVCEPSFRKLLANLKLNPPDRNNDIENFIAEFACFLPDFFNGGSMDRLSLLFDENKCFPIEIKKNLEKIPSPIRDRVTEVHLSFSSRNWMATIALSRCLLEYVIIDKQDILKVDVYRNNKKTRIKSLYDLIKDMKLYSDLKPSMTCIKVAGNLVMHPDHVLNEKIVPGKDVAEKCVENITKIISTLYNA